MILIKSGQKEHLIDLQKTGHIFMNSLSYFESIEDQTRKDNFESVSFIINSKEENPYYFHVKIDGIYKKIAKITHSEQRSYKGYIFCMHYLSEENQELNTAFKINTKNDYILIINAEKFIKRLKEKLVKLKVPYQYDLVRYKDFAGYTGPKNAFEKPLQYKDEKEFRLFLPVPQNKPFYDFHIESIKSFSKLKQVNEFANFKITTDNADNFSGVQKI